MAKKAKKKPRVYRCRRFGILNPWGDVWSPQTFDTKEEAQRYVEEVWRFQRDDVSKFTVVPVKMTMSADIKSEDR